MVSADRATRRRADARRAGQAADALQAAHTSGSKALAEQQSRARDIELEDILQSKTNQADSVSLKTKEHDQCHNVFGKENGAPGIR